jgi:methylmalonyl-CoA mutase C-terminal domain/subunit
MIRILAAKVGLDGHDRGIKIIASALRDAGMEVIYTGLHQTPEAVVKAAIEEDVDAICVSLLSGAHMTIFPRILELMKQSGLEDVILVGGGIIPPDDAEKLRAMGVKGLFGPGTDTRVIVDYIKEEIKKHRKKDVSRAKHRELS